MEALTSTHGEGHSFGAEGHEERLTAFSMPIRIDQERCRPSTRFAHLATRFVHLAREFNFSRRLMLDFFEGQQWRSDVKRNEWTVPYTGEQLAKAAAEKKEFHEGRRTWWQEKKDEVVAKIREGGITVTDSIVDEMAKTGYATTSRGIGGPVVEIDAALQAHLAEAHQKVHDHERLVKEYDAWHQMMDAHRTASFALTQGDWMYFFGK